jgi:hypothetical protein
MLTYKRKSMNYEHTRPIPVPCSGKSFSENDSTEYCLKQNFFNPNKSTPPNSWNSRLMQRLSGSPYEDHLQSSFSIFFKK